MKRPDGSSISVDDQYGDTVLSARYVNRQTFEIAAKMRLPDKRLMDLDGSQGLDHVCLDQGDNPGLGFIYLK